MFCKELFRTFPLTITIIKKYSYTAGHVRNVGWLIFQGRLRPRNGRHHTANHRKLRTPCNHLVRRRRETGRRKLFYEGKAQRYLHQRVSSHTKIKRLPLHKNRVFTHMACVTDGCLVSITNSLRMCITGHSTGKGYSTGEWNSRYITTERKT